MPVYWQAYTPVNFLYFCDVALLVTLAALWLECGLLASMQAIAITLPQLLWQVDFLSYALVRVHFPIDLTGYMFDPQKSLFLRGLSFFHFWLPILLWWMVWRLGYDRRALGWQIVLSTAVLLASYWLTPVPFNPHLGNVNKVYGPSEEAPQTWMPPLMWLGLLIVAMPVCIYVPTHFVFRWLFRSRDNASLGFVLPASATDKFLGTNIQRGQSTEVKRGGNTVIAGEQAEDRDDPVEHAVCHACRTDFHPSVWPDGRIENPSYKSPNPKLSALSEQPLHHLPRTQRVWPIESVTQLRVGIDAEDVPERCQQVRG